MGQPNNTQIGFERWKLTDSDFPSATSEMLVSVHGYSTGEHGDKDQYACFTIDGYFIGTISQEELAENYDKEETIVLTPKINL